MKKSKLSEEKQLKLIEHFVAGRMARTAAAITGVNKTTASFYFYRLRELILKYEGSQEMFDGEVELDDNYFGGRRKGKRGRGAAGKIPVFGISLGGGDLITLELQSS